MAKPKIIEELESKAPVLSLADKANKLTVSTMTLLANNWTIISDKNVYSFEENYPHEAYDLSVEIDGAEATEEQLNAWSEAKVCGASNVNRLYARGTVPTLNIPIIVRVVKK